MSEEQEHWNELCQGNSKAFEKLYSHFAQDLFRYGYRICTNHELVQDSIQDLFLHLWNKRSELGAVHSPRFYLYRSLRNKLVRSSQSDRFVFSMDGDLSEQWFPAEKDIETNWIMDEHNRIQLSRLHEALLKLPIRQQEVIQLRYYHDFSAEEIGRMMHINQQSVRNLQNRAMQQLRSELPFFPVSLLAIAFYYGF
ncbi:sigma-70 family RNA polymerase sigma factor [Dyadobacter sp. LHD-138]|uniref:RNA polymerase sigma factor n=1 Tax=Dyadobacter sp. LHD-138 TaxID=3071413 RepID=UPI0027DF109F|nr:sigma-70 family RNA polymerase sigma factor [Dyadobacter sp. LHD-138]MDQ6480658.1 sigma-70 family RNA polymerase sigma factor [Dyadobacter sp. LHD-138]